VPRRHSERRIDLTIESKSRTKTAGIGAVASESFEAVVDWNVRVAMGGAERIGMLVDKLGIGGDQ
jgi:hypothetical protein